MKDVITVYYTDNRRIVKIAEVPHPIKHRARIEMLIDSLNEKYIGIGRFEAIETTWIKQHIGNGYMYSFEREAI